MIKFHVCIVTLTLTSSWVKVSVLAAEVPPSVCTGDACYHGTYMKSFDEIKINAFLGVPYAMPPLGEKRFKDPVKWKPQKTEESHVNCKTEVAPCFYNDYRNSMLSYGHEDCLFLNIFTMGNYTNAAKKPVLIELADIDFERGDASTQLYGPEFIVTTTDSVIVTVNSRLGIFGYLAHTFDDGTIIHGNMGLKDQQMAIQWVYDNIKNFGGDPKKITLAGGAAVSYHLVNEKSLKMIKRAIVRHTNFIAPYNRPWEYTSDFNAINLRAWSSQISKHWKKFSDLLNMQTERIDEKLQNANWTICRTHPYYRFKPVVDADDTGTAPFLTDHPITIWSSNQYNFYGDVWFWSVNASSFEYLVPMFRYGFDRCDDVDPVINRPYWHLMEELYFTDFVNSPNFNVDLHRYYFQTKDIDAVNIYKLKIFDFISDINRYPIEPLFSWGQFFFPTLKMIQLRPYFQYNREFKRNYLTFYEQYTSYRCFRTTFYGEHICSKTPPNVGGYVWQVRGEELVFQYLMPWYFETPGQRWQKYFVEMGQRLKFYLLNGFQNQRSYSDIPKHCYIPRSPLSEVDLSDCAYQNIAIDDKKFKATALNLTHRDEYVQFKLWDVEIFENLELQDKVKDPNEDARRRINAIAKSSKFKKD